MRAGRRKRTGQGLLTLTHMETGVLYGHPDDERAFFEWLQRIPCVKSALGSGEHGLVVRLKRRPSRSDLRSLLALCRRYVVNMRQLAKFETDSNRSWFRNPDSYWYDAVFGSEASAAVLLKRQRKVLLLDGKVRRRRNLARSREGSTAGT